MVGVQPIATEMAAPVTPEGLDSVTELNRSVNHSGAAKQRVREFVPFRSDPERNPRGLDRTPNLGFETERNCPVGKITVKLCGTGVTRPCLLDSTWGVQLTILARRFVI